MRRYRITGRFYVVLLVMAVIAILIIRPRIRFGEQVEVLSIASSAYTHNTPAVIIRDETLITAESVTRVEYVAAENTLVYPGDTVAYMYSTGYSQTELTKLETARENIQAYHKTKLENIIDNDLERLDLIVDQRALEFKNLVTHENGGNLIIVNRLLETAMVNRQEYMRSNMRNDMKLNKLYSEENARLSSISSWRVESVAEEEGVVSFYTDGYERYINGSNLSGLSMETVDKVLDGKPLGDTSVREKDVYRIVDQDNWYVAIVTDSSVWNPVVDQEYYLQFEGFEDLGFTATVSSVSQRDNRVLAVFSIESPMGALIYQRTGNAKVSITHTGISVSVDAIYEDNGKTGVWLYDVPGGTFVPVTVLLTDGDTALIQPEVDGALSAGQRVLIK